MIQESWPDLESITSLRNTLPLSEFDKGVGLKDLQGPFQLFNYDPFFFNSFYR